MLGVGEVLLVPVKDKVDVHRRVVNGPRVRGDPHDFPVHLPQDLVRKTQRFSSIVCNHGS
jgi:hypothetical protein